MTETKRPATGAGPNRRKELFRAVRGSKLTGQRGSWLAGPDSLEVAGAASVAAGDEPQSPRRVRLGSVVEDEAASAGAHEVRRYSEPND